MRCLGNGQQNRNGVFFMKSITTGGPFQSTKPAGAMETSIKYLGKTIWHSGTIKNS